MTEPALDLYLPVETRDGRPVRIVCRNAKNGSPVVGLVTERSGSETVMSWSLDGRWMKNGHTSTNDLVYAASEQWVNQYDEREGPLSQFSRIYPSEEAAKESAHSPGYVGTFQLVRSGDNHERA